MTSPLPPRLFLGLAMMTGLQACGLYTPLKTVSEPDHPAPLSDGTPNLSRNGVFESSIISNIRCEVRKGLYRASQLKTMPYLEDWGTTITLTLTWDEMSAVAPGLSIIHPLKLTDTFTLGAGVSSNAHATREEKISFTLENRELLAQARDRSRKNLANDCDQLADGTQIKSDLHIDQFIFDKASIASGGAATTGPLITKPQFSVFQETLTFVASFSGSATPSWKLARFTANNSGTFLSATRSVTSVALITLGPLDKKAPKGNGPQLSPDARQLHNSSLTGGSTGASILSQTP